MDGKKKMLIICEKVTSFQTEETHKKYHLFNISKMAVAEEVHILFCCFFAFFFGFFLLFFFHFKILFAIKISYNFKNLFLIFFVVCVVEVVCFLFAREFHFICNSLRWMLYSVAVFCAFDSMLLQLKIVQILFHHVFMTDFL